MVSPELLRSLINRPENETIDFKLEAYNLSEEHSKAALIKDVLCMANTPRDEDAYIILGARRTADGRTDLPGLDRQLDDADLQSQFADRCLPSATR
jgi:hypothetical protein